MDQVVVPAETLSCVGGFEIECLDWVASPGYSTLKISIRLNVVDKDFHSNLLGSSARISAQRSRMSICAGCAGWLVTIR